MSKPVVLITSASGRIGKELVASYDPDKDASRKGAAIPLMLQYYWWGEKALIDAGLNVSVLCNS